MNLKDVARPGLMISNVEPESRKEQGRTLEVLEEAMELDFFEAYQTVEVPYPAERLQIARHAKAKNFGMTYCLARVLNDNKLDLSALDEQLRKTSVEKLIPHLEDAVQQGSDVVQVISGPADADPNKRLQQLRRFEKSWLELCEAARKYDLKVIVEPLDTQADKKKAVGSTAEAVEMVRNLADEVDNAFLCLDTSHMILNGEDVVSSVKTAMDYINEFHICNPVLAIESPLFGDKHIKFGAPGVLDVQAVGSLIAECRRIGFFSVSRRPKLFLEVRNTGESVPDLIRYCRQTLLDAWDIARGQLQE
ncbi:MAG TPA: TIM barrel protein [Sedimentisphaerales bacterium]|nr:TIM barrel protein [Sedimentisphaerales bacterium]